MITSPARSPQRRTEHAPTPYVDLSRDEWSALRDKTPLPLTADEVERLRGLGDVIDLDEVRDVYLPLSRLLNLYVQATSGLRGALNTFLGDAGNGHGAQRGTPFVIGVAGSVAVGKSTSARILQALLARWPEHPRVELVTTDGFLLPMKELKARGLTSRKGFPESYDRRALTRFVADIKAGKDRGDQRREPSAFIDSRTYRSPTAVWTSRMPSRSMASLKPRFDMTVPTTVSFRSCPASRMARASTARIWSPSTSSPAASTARQRSASPSCAMPRSAPCSTTAARSSSRWVEPQPSLMLRPSGSAPMVTTWAPAARTRPARPGRRRRAPRPGRPSDRRAGWGGHR
ncbi:Pantothenate kinase [Streptomyces badius]